MSDLDRYLTDELVEKVRDELAGVVIGGGYYAMPIAVDEADRLARKALEAAAPLIAAKALRDAADGYQSGGWAGDLPASGSRPALILGMSQRAVEWLHDRANQIEQEVRP